MIENQLAAGVEAGVVGAVIFSALGFVVFLFGFQTEKYFVEIFDDGININNMAFVEWNQIADIKKESLNYKGVGLGTPIAIHHSDEKGKKSVTRLPAQLENGEKLYKL
jgi:hypothetical protein